MDKKIITAKAGTTKYKQQFNKNNYKQLKVEIKPDDYTIIDTYVKQHGTSKAKFIVAACKYCIDNNIDLNKE